jgi:CelD/BcsL family acetyltransferase involved in cellulose biosynthesis
LTGIPHTRDTRASDAPAARLATFDAITSAELDAWHTLRAANPALASPYFHPQFAATVHASGTPVSVVVLRDATGAVTTVLPGHIEKSRLRPVGWPAADFQGPVFAAGTALPPMDLLFGGVRCIEFDHLLSPGPAFDPYIVSTRPSPYLDTTGGLDGYLGRASRTGKDNMSQARRRAAKAERAIGPVRFTADTVDDGALARVIALKRAQYAATGGRDYFDRPDRVDLMSRLLHTRGTDFAGILSTLHIGDELVAAHFGIRSDHVLHWWFPVYDPAFAQLSPGWMLLRELVAASPTLGIRRIDLGRGDDEYKRRAKTGEVQVCQGVLTRSGTRRILRRARHAAIETAKASPLGPKLRTVVRRTRISRSAVP